MKPSEIKNKSQAELKVMLGELQHTLLKLGFDLADKKLKDSSQFGKVRKDIARVLTTLNNLR
jgi:ribosomal protein L29